MSCLLLILSLGCLFPLSCVQTPIPQSPPGYLFMGSRSSRMVIEVFYDNLCYGSAMNWPVFSKAIAAFENSSLGVIIHIFPLPYHRNSFLAAWAGETILESAPSNFPVYMSYLFQYFDDFISKAVNLTELEVKQKYATYVDKYVGISYNTVMEGYQDSSYNMNARYAWKYACSRGVTGTPTFLVNGVVVPEASEYSYYTWSMFILKFLQVYLD